MAVRSALPWPLRWAMAAVVLGFSAAIALWAFELGKDIAGLDGNAREELRTLREANQRLANELAEQQSVSNTADSLLVAERAAQEQLVQQIRGLEADNRRLRSDLGFFEQLMPSTGASGLHIRGLQVQRQDGGQVHWQVLVMQPLKQAPEFRGRLLLRLDGTLQGKAWSLELPPQEVVLRQYLRLDGAVDVPPQAVLKTVTARLLQGDKVQSTETQKL
jgi:hypothetical protein